MYISAIDKCTTIDMPITSIGEFLMAMINDIFILLAGEPNQRPGY